MHLSRSTLRVSRGVSPFALAVSVSALALVARLLYVQCFATPMPYMDQWDGEWAGALKPLLEGALHWQMLIAPHNEHRILPTRLVTLLSYMATGEWNNVHEARIAAVVFCFIPGLLTWHALRDAEASARRWMPLLAVLLSVLPFAWENVLVGFQSQFYFLILSSLVAIALVARHHQSIAALAAAVALSMFACATMASGLLTAVATGATCVMACLCLPGRRGPALCATALLAVVAIAAYAWVPVVEAHAVLRAQSVGEFVHAAGRVLAWPMRSAPFALIIWLPAVVMIVCMLVHRRASPADLVMAGLCLWSALQALAIAYGRGHEMRAPMSRYTELFVPGLFASAWFALRLWSEAGQGARWCTATRTVVVLFALVVAWPLLGRAGKDAVKLQQFSAAARLQQDNVQRHLAGEDLVAPLQSDGFELPYPDAENLKQRLADPLLLRVLPGQRPEPAPPGGAGLPPAAYSAPAAGAVQLRP